ncbi:MAG: YceI family protein [Saprospiraceae bacterium]|nr:YceI family protein [Saprospiraceae bacterium]
MKHFIVCVLCGLTVLIMSAFGILEFDAANFGPGGPDVYQCTTGSIQFKSEAPLELIEARSTQLLGAINPANQTFAWSVDVLSFSGFNSTLQREHFNENYLESGRYPKATFAGKIIEKIDFEKDGVYSVRAKGKLNVHGVEQERIIKGQLERKGRKLHISASFSVPLTDHNITVPKIVYQKIAQEILITVDADLVLKP